MAEKQDSVITQNKNDILILSKPYRFEGVEYHEIDLRGLDKLTIQDAIDIQKKFLNQQEVAGLVVTETTTAFAMELASRATGLPIEFFKLLPRNAGRKVKGIVQQHLHSNTTWDNGVLRLETPHEFQGETYQEIDLSGIADLTVLQESSAENMMTQAGFIVTENTFNYLYACIIASMATNKPKTLFTSLPLCELLSLKNAVNDTGFFE